MRYIIFSLLIVFGIGCGHVVAPQYIQEKHPYTGTYYAAYDHVLETTKSVLHEYGWEITGESDPSVFEHQQSAQYSEPQQSLLFVEKKSKRFLSKAKEHRLNVYIRSMTGNAVDVEIRYITMTSFLFRKSYDYTNDHEVGPLLSRIEEALQ